MTVSERLVIIAALVLAAECQTIDGAPVADHCGNQVIEAQFNEFCDDGNLVGGDGCGFQCQVENSF